MGADCTQYVMIAWKTTYEDEEERLSEEKYDEYIGNDSIPGLDTVADGMCGEYLMIGKIIASISSDDDEMEKIDFAEFESTIKDVESKIRKLFGVQDPEVCLYAFNHWS